MFIIWGFRQSKKELGIVGFFHCNRCNNDSEWRLLKIVSWFTVFFIPLIPYRTKYYAYCPICHDASAISKEEAQRIMAEQKSKAAEGSFQNQKN